MTASRTVFPMLPSAQLAKALEALERVTMGSACKRAGVSDRTFRDWRDGGRPTCNFKTADIVLTRLGLFWWEVWTDETTRRYAITAVSYSWRMSSGRGRKRRLRREPVAMRCYGDLGPDWEALGRVEFAFTGEHPDLGEQLEMAA